MRSSEQGRGRARKPGGKSGASGKTGGARGSGKAGARTGGGKAGARAAERPGASAASRARAARGGSDAEHVGQLYARIYEVVRRIPRGRVLTYGQVAELAGMPGAARVAGAAMRASSAQGLPWQRVVGARRRGVAQVSIHDPVGAGIQRGLLEEEGVVFSDSGGISLAEHGWIDAVRDGTGKPRGRGKRAPASGRARTTRR